MKDYKPPYSITEKMLNLVSSISTKLGKIEVYHNLDNKPHLRRNNRIQSVHSSLKIEANSLTIGQTKDIIDGRMVLGPKQEIQEVKNAYKAYELIGKVNPYSVDDLKKVQGIMEYLLKDDSGRFRNGNEGVFNGEECIFMAPSPQLVPELIQDLFEWMKINRKIVHPLIMGAIFHYEFVFIHPFSDGNGRTARLWHTILLNEWNPIFAYIPLESQIEKFQNDYYTAISKCHVNGNSDVFIEFMLERIDDILDEVSEQVRKSANDVSEYVKRMLKVMEFEVPYTTLSLMELLGLKSRETFRKNYMDPALSMGVVERTIPEKPNSKNQRYIKR